MNISFLRGLVSLLLLAFVVGACGGSSGGGGNREDNDGACWEKMQECLDQGICTDEFTSMVECMDTCDHIDDEDEWDACYESKCGTVDRAAETCFVSQCFRGMNCA